MRSSLHFRARLGLAVVALSCCALLPRTGIADPSVAPLRVVPESVEVGGFYHGTKVEVVGELPVGYQAAVLVTGGERALDLRKKGKVWGVLWMTVGGVKFEHVPELYLLATTAPLADLAPAADRERLGTGLDVLAGSLQAIPDERDVRTLAGELVKLRQDEGLFALEEGAARVQAQQGGPGLLSADFRLPARVREGTYEVRLLGFREGAGTVLATTQLTVRRVGITHMIGDLARQQGLLYGILAVLAALGVGLLTGAVFGRGASKGH